MHILKYFFMLCALLQLHAQEKEIYFSKFNSIFVQKEQLANFMYMLYTLPSERKFKCFSSATDLSPPKGGMWLIPDFQDSYLPAGAQQHGFSERLSDETEQSRWSSRFLCNLYNSGQKIHHAQGKPDQVAI